MNRIFHRKSDIHKLHIVRKRGGHGLISCTKCVKREENNLGWYLRNLTENLLLRIENFAENRQVLEKLNSKNRIAGKRTQKWIENVCINNLSIICKMQWIEITYEAV